MKSSETSLSQQRYSFLLWLIQVLFMWCCITVVIWLSLNPKHPVFKVADVYVHPAADHVCNSTLTQVHEVTQNRTPPVIILNLKISNPNKRIGYIYDGIYVGLYYEDRMIIGTSSLPAFYQGHRNSTIGREVQVNIEEQYLGGLLGKTFDMRVYLKTKLRYKIFGFKTKHHMKGFEAYVAIGSDGRMLGEDIKMHQRQGFTILNLTTKSKLRSV
ncbi:hypothetical protein SLA2020_220650 [Shorea laevis]